jgi:hypothetical protein
MNSLGRFTRFSLRSFFLFSLATGIGIGWLGMHYGAARRDAVLLKQLAERIDAAKEISLDELVIS